MADISLEFLDLDKAADVLERIYRRNRGVVLGRVYLDADGYSVAGRYCKSASNTERRGFG